MESQTVRSVATAMALWSVEYAGLRGCQSHMQMQIIWQLSWFNVISYIRCNEGRLGRLCECSQDEFLTDDLDANCRKDNGTGVCSNNGECVCGTCECKKRENPEEIYSGKFCECDNFSCDRSNNKLCGGTTHWEFALLSFAVFYCCEWILPFRYLFWKTRQKYLLLRRPFPTGHGRCECKKCICDANYKGSACECPLDTSTCLANNKLICNGRGTCECGVCKCTDKKYEGPICEICPTCSRICNQNKWVIGWILANEVRLT